MVAESKTIDHAPAKPVKSSIHALLKRAVLLIPLGIAGNMLILFFSSTSLSLPVLSTLDLVALTLTALLAVVPWFTDSLRLFIWGGSWAQTYLIRNSFGSSSGESWAPPSAPRSSGAAP